MPLILNFNPPELFGKKGKTETPRKKKLKVEINLQNQAIIVKLKFISVISKQVEIFN